jgi:hypothetical protein
VLGKVIGAFAVDLTRGNLFDFYIGVTLCPPFKSKAFCLFGIVFGIAVVVGVDVVSYGICNGYFVNHGFYFLSLVGTIIITKDFEIVKFYFYLFNR